MSLPQRAFVFGFFEPCCKSASNQAPGLGVMICSICESIVSVSFHYYLLFCITLFSTGIWAYLACVLLHHTGSHLVISELAILISSLQQVGNVLEQWIQHLWSLSSQQEKLLNLPSWLAVVKTSGRFGHPKCVENRTMAEFLQQPNARSLWKAGGLGHLSVKGSFGSWICIAGHHCLDTVNTTERDRMCYVAEKHNSVIVSWHAWGVNSELGLCGIASAA